MISTPLYLHSGEVYMAVNNFFNTLLEKTSMEAQVKLYKVIATPTALYGGSPPREKTAKLQLRNAFP